MSFLKNILDPIPSKIRLLLNEINELDVIPASAAFRSLCSIKDERVMPALIEVLGSSHSNLWYEAKKRLVEIGNSSVELLIAALENDNKIRIELALQALAEIKNPIAIPHIISKLSDNDSRVKVAAIKSLVQLIQKESIKDLRKLLVEDKDCQVRIVAAEYLISLEYDFNDELDKIMKCIAFYKWDEVARFGSSAIKPLIIALQDKSNYVFISELTRTGAARTLGKIGGRDCVIPLITALEDECTEVRFVVAESLSMIGKTKVEEVLNISDNTEKDINEIFKKISGIMRNIPRRIEYYIGAVLYIPRGWSGLAWDISSNTAKDSSFIDIVPGSYLIDKIEGQWVFIKMGSLEYKLDASDVETYLIRNR